MRWIKVSISGASLLLGTALAWPAAAQPPRPQEGPRRLDPTRLLGQFDTNKDGFLERSEIPERMKERFDQMDANKDGKLTKEELEKAAGRLGNQPPGRPGQAPPDALFRLLDANGDGKLSREELQNAAKHLEKLDRDKDGMLDRDEVAASGRPGGRSGEIITPAAKGERQTDKLEVGEQAPDFTLPLLSGKGAVTLSSFRGRKPVVLIFASYT